MMDLAEARRLLELSLADYSEIRAKYWAEVYDTIYAYLTTDMRVDSFRNQMKRSMSYAFLHGAETGYLDGGGSLPFEEDANSVYVSAQNQEYANIDNLAERLRLLKKEGDADAIHEAYNRAEGYARTLDYLYSQMKVMAAGSKMLTFVGEDGAESCSDCMQYKNKRHRASWWVSHDAVPPNRRFECGGWRCQHILVDDEGRIFTI